MNLKTYRGRIFLQSSGHPVEVSCQATNPQQAIRIIQGIYGDSFKSFARQMASN